MGNFDVTTPAGSDLLSQGDDKIREFKLAMREALRAGAVAGDDIEGVEAIFPGSSPSTAPVYRYRGLKGTTAERPTAGQYGFYYDTDRKVLQRDNGTSWEDVGQVVADGSITEAKLSASVAGDGLSGGANTPLAVNVGAGLEISSDAVRIAAAAAGNGLSGGAGSALSVNVDDSTIEINTDALRVKDGGITLAKLNKHRANITWTAAGNTSGYQTSPTSWNFDPVNISVSSNLGITGDSTSFTIATSGSYVITGRWKATHSNGYSFSSQALTLEGTRTIVLDSAVHGNGSYSYIGVSIYLEAGAYDLDVAFASSSLDDGTFTTDGEIEITALR